MTCKIMKYSVTTQNSVYDENLNLYAFMIL
jgi:hypothetical protein